MARLNFSFDISMNLRLPLDDAQSNFVWANIAHNAAFTRHQFCILKGYGHKHKNRYGSRPILTESPWDERQTLKYIRQLVEETDDLDRFRNHIEGLLIDRNEWDPDQKESIKLHFRSYNRYEEQKTLVADIEKTDLTSVHAETLTNSSLERWSEEFQMLIHRCTLTAFYERITSRDHHVIPVTQPQLNVAENMVVKRRASTEPNVQKTTRKKVKTNHQSSILPTVDPVIEQWYTDPYNRHNPEGPVGVKLRKQVLTTALRNRGFRGNRVASIVSWLVRCKGRYKGYDELMGSYKRKTGHPAQRRSVQGQSQHGNLLENSDEKKSTEVSNVAGESGKGIDQSIDDKHVLESSVNQQPYPSPLSVGLDQNSECVETEDAQDDGDENADIESDDDLFNFTNSNKGETDFGADVDADSQFYPFANPAERAAVIQQIKEEIIGVRPSFHSIHPPGTQGYQDDYDDWRLEDLKRTQAFWNIIYGDDLDNAPANEDMSFTYFRDPDCVPRPDVQYPSQGLKTLKNCTVNGKEAWTEDETFGLYVPKKRERVEQKVGDCIKQEVEEAEIE